MVSVVIPIYNGEKYIKRCFDVLLSGDISEIEILAVNDGSKDNSSKLLHEYETKCPALRVIDKENGGAASARQRGALEAKGDYVAFLDIDDLPEADMYTALEQKARESGADVVFCNYFEECGGKQKTIKNIFREGETLPMDGQTAIRYLHSRRAIFPFPWNKIYKRELFEHITFPKGNFVGEDYNMLLQIFELSNKVDHLDRELYHYELTAGSASRSGYTAATLRAYENFKKDREYIETRHPEMLRDIDNYLTAEYMACIIAMGRNKTYNKEMIKEIKHFVRLNLGNYLSSPDVDLTMKASALVLSVSYRLLILAYKIIKR